MIDRMAHDIPRVALVDGHWVLSKHECTIVKHRKKCSIAKASKHFFKDEM